MAARCFLFYISLPLMDLKTLQPSHITFTVRFIPPTTTFYPPRFVINATFRSNLHRRIRQFYYIMKLGRVRYYFFWFFFPSSDETVRVETCACMSLVGQLVRLSRSRFVSRFTFLQTATRHGGNNILRRKKIRFPPEKKNWHSTISDSVQRHVSRL